jgi:hypothetical protein
VAYLFECVCGIPTAIFQQLAGTAWVGVEVGCDVIDGVIEGNPATLFGFMGGKEVVGDGNGNFFNGFGEIFLFGFDLFKSLLVTYGVGWGLYLADVAGIFEREGILCVLYLEKFLCGI